MELFFLAVAFYGIGILSMLLPRSLQVVAHYAANVSAILGSGLVTYGAGGYMLGLLSFPAWKWGSYSLSIDAWSGFFLLLTGVASCVTSLYALGYARSYEGNRLRHLGGNWNLFIGSMVLVLLAGDAFSFLLFWEIMAVASFLLVNHEAHLKTTWTAAYQYLVMTSVGTTALMIAFFVLGAYSYNYSFAALAQNSLSPSMQHVVFCAAFAGFALKAGLVPLHIWLPNAHPAAPSHVSALMSGIMLKIALYGFGRFMLDFLPEWNYWWAILVMVLGVVSAFLGVLYAQMEIDIKRILAYSSVENMGVIFAAFGCGMLLKVTVGGNWYLIALAGALLHACNHSFMKVLMFMSAGSIMHGTGSKNLELFGGLASRMPYTAACTLVGALALSAIPLTCGFTGEWLTLQGFMVLAKHTGAQDIRLWSALSMILLGFTGALALGCFVRYYGIAFLGRARSEIAEHAHESDVYMLSAMFISSALVLLGGIFPLPLIQLVSKALKMHDISLVGSNFDLFLTGDVGYNPLILLGLVVVMGALLAVCVNGAFVEQSVTWNCGTYPTERQQYSATGFSKPILRAFDYLLQPKRDIRYARKVHAYFGQEKSYKLMLSDMVDEKLYRPMQKYFVVASVFLRRLQQGSVRLYVGYVMVAMVLTLVWGTVFK